jgi:hypothetical protein
MEVKIRQENFLIEEEYFEHPPPYRLGILSSYWYEDQEEDIEGDMYIIALLVKWK